LMPRDCRAPADGCCGGGVGLAAGKRRVPVGTFLSCRVDTIAPGSRRRPPRSGLMRVQRGNPVEVRPRKVAAGRPTVREAEVLGGNRMVQEANAGGSKGDGKAAQVTAPPVVVSYNRPDTGLGGLPRKGADVGRVGLRRGPMLGCWNLMGKLDAVRRLSAVRR
jgi:hypothetical protein